jgi:hypothetical protein
MRLDFKSKSGPTAAIVTVVNVVYFIGVSFMSEPSGYSSAVRYGALINLILAVAACIQRAWSVAVVLISFALLLLRVGIDFAI